MTDAARGEGRVVRQHRLAEQSLGDRSAEPIRDLGHLGAGVEGALTNQDGDPLPAIHHFGRGAELIRRGLVDDRHPRRRCSRARIAHRALVRGEAHHLRVFRHSEMGDPTITERGPAGAVGHQHGVFRSGHFDVVERDVLHELCCIEALLVARPDRDRERSCR